MRIQKSAYYCHIHLINLYTHTTYRALTASGAGGLSIPDFFRFGKNH